MSSSDKVFWLLMKYEARANIMGKHHTQRQSGSGAQGFSQLATDGRQQVKFSTTANASPRRRVSTQPVSITLNKRILDQGCWMQREPVFLPSLLAQPVLSSIASPP